MRSTYFHPSEPGLLTNVQGTSIMTILPLEATCRRNLNSAC
jgi:hypothetical protein